MIGGVRRLIKFSIAVIYIWIQSLLSYAEWVQ